MNHCCYVLLISWLTISLLLKFGHGDTSLDNFLMHVLNVDKNPKATTSDVQATVWKYIQMLQPKIKDVPYNPDQDLTTPEIAARHGYVAETHTLKTIDGYILTLHRMPCGQSGCRMQGGRGKGQPVFLQHGLLASSADWLLSGPQKGLGFILADAGYDVWMGNARGNSYSRKHVSMKNDQSAFWDFSWHEMAVYDLPAEIDYVYETRALEQNVNETDTDLLYIGHSMGTTMMFALLSTIPEYNDKIKAMFALAPVAYMSHVKSPIRLLAPFSKDFEIPMIDLEHLVPRIPPWVDGIAHEFFKHISLNLLMIMKFFGADEFLPQNRILRFLAKYGCELTEAEKIICENTIFVICGFDKKQYNATLMPVIFAHSPAGTSTKTVVHFAQEIQENGNFQHFDYGERENLRRYGQSKPPLYDVDNIRVPISLFYANNDWLAGSQDVAKLFSKLSKSSIGMFKVPFDGFNHVDFLWGTDVVDLVYRKLLELMHRYR